MKISKLHKPKDVYKEEYLHNPFNKKINNNKINLKEYRKRVRSQSGEDGIIEHVFSKIPARKKYYVEFGAADGEWLSNTWNLRNNFNWNGLLMDSDSEAVKKSNGLVHLEDITSQNINDLFQKYSVPENFDFLSIDIDGDDIYIFDALDSKYRPVLICGESNPGLPNQLPLAIEEGMTDKWGLKRRNTADPYDYHGCNIHAWHHVGKQKGYNVLTTSHVNVFLIAEEYSSLFYIPTLEEISVPPYFNIEHNRFLMGASNNDERYFWCEIE
jgi:hypothetical protein